MMVVGLTGGIGSGKSLVSQYFSELGVPIIDADVIVHQLMQPGRVEFDALVQCFGQEILDASGNIDRRAMRKRVFQDLAQLKKLEAIIHPAVRKEISQQIQKLSADYCIVSIPLLLEKDYKNSVDRVLVIDVAESVQIERVKQRDGSTEDQVRNIMKKQISRNERLAAADDVINNENSAQELQKKVCDLHHKYLKLSQ